MPRRWRPRTAASGAASIRTADRPPPAPTAPGDAEAGWNVAVRGIAPGAGARKGSAPEVLILAGRDSSHPDGGGSELYIERVAAGLVRLGHEVTLFCGSYAGAVPAERIHGVRVLRRGGRLSVFAHAAVWLRTGRLGRPAVIVDVHNGLPFFSRWYTRKPVIVLVH